jgi:hypothetical protein
MWRHYCWNCAASVSDDQKLRQTSVFMRKTEKAKKSPFSLFLCLRSLFGDSKYPFTGGAEVFVGTRDWRLVERLSRTMRIIQGYIRAARRKFRAHWSGFCLWVAL